MIDFNGLTIPCDDMHGLPVFQPPESKVNRAYFWATGVTNEIRGGKSGRQVTINCWVYDVAGSVELEATLGALELYINDHGTLNVVLNNYTVDVEGCTLMGVHRIQQPGQREPGILPDVINSKPVSPGGYWQEVVLQFYQLSVE